MRYKKIETQIKHDKVRNEHIQEIQRLEKMLTFIPFNSEDYTRINERLNLMVRQLKLYDKIMYER